jgi:hypothetical protein
MGASRAATFFSAVATPEVAGVDADADGLCTELVVPQPETTPKVAASRAHAESQRGNRELGVRPALRALPPNPIFDA